MNSPLNVAKFWILEHIVYMERVLYADVAEGIVSPAEEDILINKINIGPAHSIEVTSASRRYRVIFNEVHSFEVVDESYANVSKYGEPDYDPLRQYDRSEYLDYVKATSLIPALLNRPIFHYALITQDDVIHAICCLSPTVEKR